MTKLLLVGAGKWGQKYISTLNTFPDVELQIADRNNWRNLIDEIPDGVIVCTPPNSHVEIASYSMLKGIPTMIEKPLSLSLSEAESLTPFKVPVLVNHIHLFSEAYQNLKNVVHHRKIDKITSLGFNKGPVRAYSSLWDYGCHDLSMILDLTNSFPQQIEASELRTDTGSLFNIKLQFDTFYTESLVGNGGQKPVRKIKVDCDGIKVVYDDKERPNHHIPPLTNALRVFIDAIGGKPDYRLGLDLSLKVIQILESCKIR